VVIDSMSDQGVSEAIYVHDPDFNSLELYCDRDPSQWPRDASGNLQMITDMLDLASLLSELENE
jgi:catechol 2,3-dioxygenase